MERRQLGLMMIAALAVLLFAGMALADPVAPTALDPGDSSSRNLSTLAAQQVDAIAGNITRLDITALTITQGWQGYYGDVTGSITLDNADNETFYNWSITTAKGEIFASRNDSIDWGSIDCADAAAMNAENTALQLEDGADNVTNTFTEAGPAFTVAGNDLNGCPSTNAFTSVGAGADFVQILLNDGAHIVYGTIIGEALGFDGGTYDFELLVGEDGRTDGVTPYYFWVELG